MRSPYGSEFRELMTLWDKQLLLEKIDELRGKIKHLIDGHNFILFLQKKDDGDVFGADENGRLVFAKMKSPDEDMPEGWADEANFGCTNLSRAVAGSPSQTIFGMKDLENLDVIEDQDKLIDMLLGHVDKKKEVKVKPVKNQKDGAKIMLKEPEGSTD